ncbi:MAG: TetR/AcrR family transcriptional regulator [Pseudomonadota bacterium]
MKAAAKTVCSAKTDCSKAYHHGDLRNELILAACALIEERGSSDFSVAEAARRAGVSNAAPYRHFRDKDELLEAVCELGFLGLAQSAQDALEGQEPGTEEAIIALGHAYIRFVISHRHFHDLMWGQHGVRAMDTDTAEDLRGSGFYILVHNLNEMCKKENIVGVDTTDLATKLWGLVHGLSALSMTRQLDRFKSDADPYEMLSTTSHIFFAGLRQNKA